MKQKYMFAGVFLLLIMCVGMASAATTLNTPVTNTNYTTIEFNVTTDLANADNCSIYYNAAGGEATTLLDTIVNESVGDTDFTEIISIEGLDDLLTYNFTATCIGDTTENATAVEAVGIDNTVPVISVDRAGAAYIDYMTSISISCSATDATTSVSSTTRTLTKPSGETVTTTTSPYTFSGGDLNELGGYTFTCSATDNPGNTNSDTVTFTVQTDDDVIIDNGVDDSQKKSSNKLLFLLILGVAAICVIVLILLVGKKK